MWMTLKWRLIMDVWSILSSTQRFYIGMQRRFLLIGRKNVCVYLWGSHLDTVSFEMLHLSWKTPGVGDLIACYHCECLWLSLAQWEYSCQGRRKAFLSHFKQQSSTCWQSSKDADALSRGKKMMWARNSVVLFCVLIFNGNAQMVLLMA